MIFLVTFAYGFFFFTFMEPSLVAAGYYGTDLKNMTNADFQDNY